MSEFGKKLRETRISKNFSLEEVSERLKIRIHILDEIENGNLKILPPVYLKSFIKTYSDFLNIDSRAIIEEMNSKEEISTLINENTNNPQHIGTKKRPLQMEDTSDLDYVPHAYDTESANDKPTPIANIIIYFAVGVIILTALYFGIIKDLFSVYTNKDVVAYDENPDSTVIENSESQLFEDFKPQGQDSIILVAKGIKEAWMKIIIDGKRSEEVLMKPGLRKRWAGKESFSITQGNVGGIQYFRNDVLLEPFGMKGSMVRNIIITKDKILNATTGDQDSIKKIYFEKKKPKEEKKAPILIQPVNFDNDVLRKRLQKESEEENKKF